MQRLIASLSVCIAIFLFGKVTFANEISLDNGGMTLSLPDGFDLMPENVKIMKYPNVNRPQHIYSNNDYSVSIGIKFTNSPLRIYELEELKLAMTEILPRAVPNLRWMKKEVIDINNRKWLVMEFKSSAIDTDIHNISLATAYNGKILQTNFSSTVERFDEYATELRKSIISMKVKEKPMYEKDALHVIEQILPVVQMHDALLNNDVETLLECFNNRIRKELLSTLGKDKIVRTYRNAYKEAGFFPYESGDFTFSYKAVDERFGIVQIHYKGEKLEGAVKRVELEEGEWRIAEK